ncbi:MAG TPA: hypothetical protein VHH34_08330 [Pseudonocardiaceae bacterium]|nr:hypothetical protein [Pseudonocardiaceae bacterium]
MSRELNCPHCGCPLLATPDAVRVPAADTVELLNREIEQLRTTIARLRGAGFNPLAPRQLADPTAS